MERWSFTCGGVTQPEGLATCAAPQAADTEPMNRYIRLTVDDNLSDDQYADLANAVWMLLRNTHYNFYIEHDGKTSAAVLNDAWTQYGSNAVWE